MSEEVMIIHRDDKLKEVSKTKGICLFQFTANIQFLSVPKPSTISFKTIQRQIPNWPAAPDSSRKIKKSLRYSTGKNFYRNHPIRDRPLTFCSDQCKSNPRVSSNCHPEPVNWAYTIQTCCSIPSPNCITDTSKFSSVTRKENERYYLFNNV